MRRLAATIFLIIPLFVFCQSTSVKSTGTVAGNVLDDKGKPVGDATVILLQKNSDSALKFTRITNNLGAFDFNKLPYGYYKLTVRAINFAEYSIDSIYLREEKNDFVLGDISLKNSANNLNEVVVYSEKPLIENKDDKIVYNVGESPLANGASTFEMMKNMPLITIDPDGSIKLAGKEPLILMDEKPTNVSGQNLQDLLESLPANVVEKVEIMQNPPPEYATYSGGVINIVTKKGRIGTYKKITATAGTRGEAGLSGSYSYRNAKLNINGYAGYNVAKYIGNSYSRRQNFYHDTIHHIDSTNYFYTDATSQSINHRPGGRVQADYEFNKRNNISLVYQNYYNFFSNSGNVLYQNLDSNKKTYKASTRQNANDGDGYSHGFSGSYLWKGIKPVERLQVTASYNIGKNDNLRDFYQQYLLADFLPSGIDSTQNQYTDNYSHSLYARADYNKHLNDTASIIFTGGTTISANSYHNVLNTSYLRKSDSTFIINNLLSNDFLFRQTIFTVRGGLIWILPKDIRAEYTHTSFQFIKGNANNVSNGYWRLLPSFTLRKQFNKQLSSTLVFRESIRRPGIVELNPSIDYSDPYNVRFGNPYIAPALTDNYDGSFSYNENKFNLGVSVGYGKIKEVFSSIRTLIDSGKTQTTYQNISDQEEYHANTWMGVAVSKKIRINLSGGMNYNSYSDKVKQLYRYIDGGTYYTAVNCTYSPDNVTVIEANNRYSSFANPQGRTRSNVNITLSAQRKFFKKQLIVGITAIDPFGLLKYTGYTTAPNFIIESYSSTNTQNFRLTISYQVSKTKLKSNLSDKQKQQSLNNVKKA
jgi:ferric enterobactin receptor